MWLELNNFVVIAFNLYQIRFQYSYNVFFGRLVFHAPDSISC